MWGSEIWRGGVKGSVGDIAPIVQHQKLLFVSLHLNNFLPFTFTQFWFLSSSPHRDSTHFSHMRIMQPHIRNRPFFAHLCGSYPHMRPILNAYPHIRGNSIRALAYILSIILWPISLYWQGAKIIIYIYWYIYPSLLDILLILFYIYFSTVRLFVSVCSSVLTFFEFVFGPFGWTLSSLDSHISLYLSKYICIYIYTNLSIYM